MLTIFKFHYCAKSFWLIGTNMMAEGELGPVVTVSPWLFLNVRFYQFFKREPDFYLWNNIVFWCETQQLEPETHFLRDRTNLQVNIESPNYKVFHAYFLS